MPQKKTFYLMSLGCPKNAVDSDCIASTLARDGWKEVAEPRESTVMVVNTCSFIVPAVEESLEAVMALADLRQGGSRSLVVAGCLVSRYGEETLTPLLPEVDLFVSFSDYPRIAALLDVLTAAGGSSETGGLTRDRSSTLGEGYVYLKIAEGCRRRCAYCAIPSIRGPLRSRPREEVREEAMFFLRRGARELVLVAQDTTSYGIDIYGRPSLEALLGDLCELEGDWRLRVMYMHPEGVDERVLEAMLHPRVCRYLDLPFQHVDEGVLRSMGRKGNALSHHRLLGAIADHLGDVALRGTFMTGFPGEDERAFAALCDFVAAVRFDWLGLFSYSHEEGTPAFYLEGRVGKATSLRRKQHLAAMQEEIMREKASGMVGRRLKVLVEKESEEAPGFWEARSEREAPAVEGVVFVPHTQGIAAGTFREVLIAASEGIDLIGVVQAG